MLKLIYPVKFTSKKKSGITAGQNKLELTIWNIYTVQHKMVIGLVLLVNKLLEVLMKNLMRVILSIICLKQWLN
jgi:hypothetical protein